MSKIVSVILILTLALALVGCSSSNLPKQDGQYELKDQSLTYDGKNYEFYWIDSSGGIHQYKGSNVKLVQDERSFVEIKGGEPVVHLKEDEPVTVLAQDNNGPFNSFWFPFLLGQALGGGLGRGPVVITQPNPGTSQKSPTDPAYRYPPTDSFGRGDTLHGDVTNDKPQAPDYTKVKPAPSSVGGKNEGTGGGTAATNKQPSAASGQQGGTGSGNAASSKGGFRASPNSPGAQAGSGKSGSASSGSGISGKNSGTGTGGAASGKSGGSISGGSKGGLFGGKSGGGRIGGGRIGGRR
ncbi:MAG: hypothetical protein EPO21_23270 [Chloroflexota bacterium]|nr:MAG: hypothetical protein EPO21_23270 [Chloroflexota bacterium]